MPGWTWEYVEENFTAAKLKALFDDFNDFPPLHILVAGAVGHKPKGKPKPKSGGSLSEMNSILSM